MGLSSEFASQGFVHVLGVRFNRFDKRQVIEQILLWLEEKSRRMVITAGPEFVMMARTSERVQRVAQAADIVTPDGIGVVWASKRLQRPVQERVTGVELVQDLLKTASDRKQVLKVYILGANDLSLKTCMDNFRTQYPHFTFSGRNGYFKPMEVDAILEDVRQFAPDLWLVGLGQPRQEQFIMDALASLPPCVAIGVGGSIDVWGGTVKRAPVFFRRLNIEWLYRLIRQPSRWKRQLALPRFAWHVLKNRGSRM